MLGIEKYMRIYFAKRRSPFPVMVVSYLFCWVAISISGLLLYANEAALVLFLAVLAIISLNYEAPQLQKFAAVTSIFALLVVTSFGIFSLLYHYAPFNILRYDINVAYLIINSLVIFLLSLSLQHFKNLRKETTFSLSPKLYVISVTVPVLSLALLFILVSYIDMSGFIEFLAIFLIFWANVFDIYLYNGFAGAHEKSLKSMLHEQEKNYYLTQCQLMQESTERALSSRHDMKIHMAALKNFIMENKNGSAIDYIDNFLGDMGESNLHSETGNLAFDSIINYKLKDIEKYGIKLNINLQVPPVLEIDDADIVTIIGNLLDNALEAVAKVAEKIITLKVALDKGVLLIESENSYSGELKEDMASLKGGSEHGHGLKNIKRSVDKYDGYMKITHTDTIVSVSIMLYANSL